MSGIVNDNTSLRSGVIKAAAGVEKRTADPSLNVLAAWATEADMLSLDGEVGGFGDSGSAVISVRNQLAWLYNGTVWAVVNAPTLNHYQSMGSAGIASAGYIVGGSAPAGLLNDTTEYDGTSWSAGGDLPGVRNYSTGGAGTQTAGLFWGGTSSSNPNNETYEYNGSSWSSGGNLGTAVMASPGTGTQSAALSFGGTSGTINSGTMTTTCQEYNGSSWSNGGSITSARAWGNCSGTQTATYAVCGEVNYPSQQQSNGQKYDGTAWRVATSTLSVRSRGGTNSQSSSTDMLIFMGRDALDSCRSTQSYKEVTSGDTTEGTVWFNTTDQHLKVAAPGGMGVWSSGANYPTGYQNAGGAGTLTAGLGWGGLNGANYNSTCYEYDGSAWTAGGTLTTGISQPGSAGIQTAAISMGGRSSSATWTTTSQQYDGTSWAASADTIGIASQQQKAVGTTTATIWFGGAKTNNSTVIANAEEFDGTTWVATTSMNNIRRGHGYAGTQSAALAASGDNYSGSSYNRINNVEEYNGVSWTEVNTITTAFFFGVGAGLQSQAIMYGGNDGSNSASLSQEYDGTTWARSNHLLTGRNSLGAFGNSMYGALAMGGDSGTSTKAVEEYQRGGVHAFIIS